MPVERQALKYCIFILTLFLTSSTYGQGDEDSLFASWQNTKNPDSVRLRSIHNLIRDKFLFSNPDSAAKLAALQFSFAEKVESIRWMAEAKNTLGISQHIQGNYFEAIDHYNASAQYAQRINNKRSISGTLNNLGIIYQDQGDYDKALEYYEKSLAIKKEIQNKNGIANSLGNIGAIYTLKGDYKKALDLFREGLAIQNELKNKTGIAGFKNNIGKTYLQLKEYDTALIHLEESLRIREEINDRKGIASTLKNISQVYQERGQFDQAVKYAKKALKIAQSTGVMLEENESAYVLYQTYKELGDYKNALQMHELYLKTMDSIRSDKTQNKIIQQDFRLRYEKKVLEDSVKNAEKQKVQEALYAAKDAENKQNELMSQKKSQQIYYLIGILCMAVIFGIFIYNRFRVTSKQKSLIVKQKKQVDDAYNELEIKNEEILDSITYARRIQTAMLPSDEYLSKNLPNSFVLYKPKDIVAGDFYWVDVKDNRTIFAVADCTGHGVPGALVSVVCNNGLKRAINEYQLSDTAEILDKTREIVIKEFEYSGEPMQDGMDIALCKITGNKLQFSGANNPIWIVRDQELIELKPDKQPIGRYYTSQPFTSSTFELQKDDIIYASTDGFADQFGGEHNKKLKVKSLKEFILSISGEALEEQSTKLNEMFEQWRGNYEQVDDVCIMAVQI